MSAPRPTFLGIGAAKSGTTSLATLLSDHPEISFPTTGRKELHYFDEVKVNTSSLQKYLANFSPNKAVGEFTPSYLFDPKCRDLIFNTLGSEIKFLVILRNPVDRAYSHYCHAVKNWGDRKYRTLGYPVETLSFWEAIESEAERLRDTRYHIRHFSYYSKGLYVDQLEYYFERFSRDNFFIFLTEDLSDNPSSALTKIFSFLGVDESYTLPPLNLRLNAQAEGSMDPRHRAELLVRYRPSIERLSKMLNRDLSHWLVD